MSMRIFMNLVHGRRGRLPFFGVRRTNSAATAGEMTVIERGVAERARRKVFVHRARAAAGESGSATFHCVEDCLVKR